MYYKIKIALGFLTYITFFYLIFYFLTLKIVINDYPSKDLEIDFHNPEISILVSRHLKFYTRTKEKADLILGKWTSKDDSKLTINITHIDGLGTDGIFHNNRTSLGESSFKEGFISIDTSYRLKVKNITKITASYEVIDETLIIKDTMIHKMENNSVLQIPEKEFSDLPIKLNGTYKRVK